MWPATDRFYVMAARNRPIVRRSVVLFAIAGLAVVAIAIAMVDVMPPSAITPTAMGETSVRIELFFQRNKHLPPDLRALPERQGYMNRTTDRWDCPLRYATDGEDAFTLSSFGKDDKPGGSGDDADTIRKHRIVRGEVQPVP